MADVSKFKTVIRTRRAMINKLLNRKQFIVDVIHPLRGTVPKEEIREKLRDMFKVRSVKLVIVFGFHTKFGGGKSTGFGFIYDNMKSLRRFEPKYRRIRFNLSKKRERLSRQARKVRKNKAKRARGKKKAEILSGSSGKK